MNDQSISDISSVVQITLGEITFSWLWESFQYELHVLFMDMPSKQEA